MEIKKDILWRAYLSFLGVVLLSLCVLGRAFYIQNVEGDHWRSLSDSMHQRYVELDAERGTIYSEDGKMLSTSIPFFDIYMDFGAEGLREKNGRRFYENIDSFSLAVAQLFGDQPSAQYKQQLQAAYKQKNRYFLLRKELTFEQYKKFRSFPLVRLGRNKSGVIAEERSKRLNPFGLLARRTIGLARDNAQNVGIERTYDTLLQGQKGKRLVRFIAGGAPVPIEGYEIEPENGRDVYTTLDIHMQDMVESALMKMMVQSGSQHGTCIVMETATGKIKAIANLGRTKDGSYSETLNYALQTTEPGSTIKLATLLAVLEGGKTKIDDLVEVGSAGHQFVAVRPVTDAERSPKPLLTVRECFAHSSNVGMAKLAFKSFGDNLDAYKKYLQKFQLHKRTGIDLMGEDAPRLPYIKGKQGVHAMLTASFGYAIEVSPLHTLMLYNAVANGGKMMKPYLVNSIKHNGIIEKEVEPVVLDEAIARPDVIAAAKSSMEAVVTEGTAKAVFKDFAIPVAGKTGTAHVVIGRSGYGGGVYQASFAGYFPANKPQYTCIVVIKTAPYAPLHYGGQLAAPVFKEVATGIYAQYIHSKQKGALSVVPDSSSYQFAGTKEKVGAVLKTLKVPYIDSAEKNATLAEVHSFQYKPVSRAVPHTKNTVPDVRNMTLRDALYQMEQRKIKVIVRGKGRVVVQDVLPGTPITKQTIVTLLFNQ